jgi:hypothetical protein
LILSPVVVAGLHRLRGFAARRPIEMAPVVEQIKTPEGMKEHMRRMHAQTIRIPGPYPFDVTFSIENHPGGMMRHMSMSIVREGRVPSPEAVWMVAEELGFSGGLESSQVWFEDLTDGSKAVNVVQPISVQARGAAVS